MKYCLVLNKNKTLIHTAMWAHLKFILLNERRYIISVTCHSEKGNTRRTGDRSVVGMD